MSTQRAAKTQDASSGASARRVDDEHGGEPDFETAEDTFDVADDDVADDEDDEDDEDDDSELEVDPFAKAAALDVDDGNTKLFREDPILDRRIIEGMLKDRNAFLDEMTHEGFGQTAVLRRAAELGLSEALIRQVKGVAADLAGERPGRRPAPSSLGARTCLSCDRVFLSSGPGNRLCMRCRGGDAGLAQL